MTVTEKHLDMLRHMLGINDPYANEPISHRNYCAANKNDSLLQEMAEAGLVEKFSECKSYIWYQCTTQGIIVATASFMQRQKPKKARRYRQYLAVSDYDHTLTFREFLTSDDYRELR